MPSKFHAFSELLAMFNDRFKSLGLGEAKPYRKPVFTPEGFPRVEEAVKAHASAHPSDPFAAKRIRHHIYQGYALPSDVLADAQRIVHAREARLRESQ